MKARAQPLAPRANLLTAPLELTGEWGGSPPSAAARVVSRMREVSLSGVRLVSDRQPEKFRVDDHSSGPPAVWLHRAEPTLAWVIVDIGARDWCKLAYQFGHELGHVLCNSWQPEATPRPPSQWLEEAFAEAFSLRALALLADSWQRDPLFAGDAGFAIPIRQYRQNLIDHYRKQPEPNLDAATWFRKYRSDLERGLGEPEGPAVLGVLALLENDRKCVADLGAVNRWPARTGSPIEDYLTRWEESCAEIGAYGRLPGQIRKLFRVG